MTIGTPSAKLCPPWLKTLVTLLRMSLIIEYLFNISYCDFLQTQLHNIRHKNGVILHACVHGRRKEVFLSGSLVDFSKRVSRLGARGGEICIYTTRN